MIFVLACLGLGMFAADCRAASRQNAAPAPLVLPPIRIGATVSLEGKYSEPSGMIRDGFKLWEKQVNERGGLLGRPVELVLYDDKSIRNWPRVTEIDATTRGLGALAYGTPRPGRL